MFYLHLLATTSILLLATSTSISHATDVVDFQQCDRQCRFQFGFYDRSITGIRVGALDHHDPLGRSCDCYKHNEKIGSLKRSTLKPWDDADFWCGNGGNSTNPGFNTSFVCVLDLNPAHDNEVLTTTRKEASQNGWSVVHCGKCSACSRPDDVRVLYNTRHTITTDMTRCAAKFAKPKFLGGDPNLVHLKECLALSNITFNDQRQFNNFSKKGGDGPTCMECWTDNIMCDSTQCNTNPSCIEKFINPNNTGAFSGCLKCDEKHCGASFIRCAGANRRSSGIISDIQRIGEEVCKGGWYWECSQCHAKCAKNDDACNAKCELLESCQGPSSRSSRSGRSGRSGRSSRSSRSGRSSRSSSKNSSTTTTTTTTLTTTTTTIPTTTTRPLPLTCSYNRSSEWSVDRRYLYMAKCNASDLAQQWSGATFLSSSNKTNKKIKKKKKPSAVTNGRWRSGCLSTSLSLPMIVSTPCDGAAFTYNEEDQTLSVAIPSPRTERGKGVGACVDMYGGAKCQDVDLWTCHEKGHKDYSHQQWEYDVKDMSLRSTQTCGNDLCLSLNRTLLPPYVETPCVWPNILPSATPSDTPSDTPSATSISSTPHVTTHHVTTQSVATNVGPPSQSSLFPGGILLVENVTIIPGYGADTFYPTESKTGVLYSGFDDGGVGGVSVTSFSPNGMGTTTGSAIVIGGDKGNMESFRTLEVTAVGGAVVENAAPMSGRYTSANLYLNGTWWIGSYGGAEGGKKCEMGTKIPQLCQLGPFVGFRWSKDQGTTWHEGRRKDGTLLGTSLGLFGETPSDSIRIGAPHVVDHGSENLLSPDGNIYVVAMGCLASSSADPTYNCSWISGDAIFVARASNVDAMSPDTLNDVTNWEYAIGSTGHWTKKLLDAAPVFEWRGRVGTTTATRWEGRGGTYLWCVTTPTRMPSTVGTYDTYVMISKDIIGTNGMKRITYMPQFGQEIYFVSIPSMWLNATHGVMTFSANFACGAGRCHSNLKGASYGANLLPIEFLLS